MRLERFRDRTSLDADCVEKGSGSLHPVDVPEAETAFRRYAGRFVAVLRTASGNAKGNCVAWLAGFRTRQEAERALAEAMALRIAVHGRDLTASEVAALARRSSGVHFPPWGGPRRRFDRLTLLHHYGRVFTPLSAAEEAADNSAFDAYMAARAAEEAEARRKAEEEAAAAKASAEAAKAAERRAAERRARESQEAREDKHLVSRLLWRSMDRQRLYQERWVARRATLAVQVESLERRLRCQGIRWDFGLGGDPGPALDLVRADWFRLACSRNGILRNLRWSLFQAAIQVAEIDSVPTPKELRSALKPRFEAYVARRRARLRKACVLA